jgi:hypothetical protein
MEADHVRLYVSDLKTELRNGKKPRPSADLPFLKYDIAAKAVVEALGSIADHGRGVMVRGFRIASAIAEMADRICPHSMMIDARRESRDHFRRVDRYRYADAGIGNPSPEIIGIRGLKLSKRRCVARDGQLGTN